MQIRSEAEIHATLDAEGKLDGLPLMPEQVECCGRKFQVYRRADRVYLDHHYYVVRLKNTVLLDDLRCDGSAHAGCQMKCLSDGASNRMGTLLNLQPGEMVEVKSFREIKKTLSSDSRLRGMGFSPDMIPFCGKRFRVSSRIERIILEWTGELKQLHDTVALDTVHCDGSSCRACPRNCYFLWREDWLKRVEQV